jgi:hypothetical protein
MPRLWQRKSDGRGIGRSPAAERLSILDAYVRSAPSPQAAIDIFTGEWASRFPPPFAELTAGQIPLFEDPRISWAIREFGDLTRRSVLELGPLEGGHTWLLTRAGAQVTAIEAQSRAYLKCLISKELLQMTEARFLLGDFMEYLRAGCPHYDVCVASGVLYHMRDPAETLALLAGAADRMMLWTHVYDQDVVTARPDLSQRFTEHFAANHRGFAHTLHRYEYADALTFTGFCGGTSDHANWISRGDLLRALDYFGWRVNAVAFEEPHHPNGPALAVIATNQPR